ncbi:MAG: alkaline phosphatase D family protein [Blastocatellia bacterium]|nr:alkaline phosphatase D family protein [Blastocatellia bacterium]
MNNITRRGFLRLSGIGLVTPYILLTDGSSKAYSFSNNRTDSNYFQVNPSLNPEDVFGLSVASGDPTPSGVILWTRINSSAWTQGDSLAFEVASDPDFNQVIVQGLAQSSDFGPERDYTVKIDLDGRLSANSYFYYRFIYHQTASRTGRCRTLPASSDSPDRIKFAVLTCQDYANGYYGAFSLLSQETDVDFVVHLGDFIYETAATSNSTYPDRLIILPSGGSASLGLDDYRTLYRTYRSDAFLQRAMEQHTWIIIWDDHETANDCYWDYARDTLGAPDHPFTTDSQYGNDPLRLKQLKLDSQRAWSEYVPARVKVNQGATHPFQYLQIYRKFKFGNLVELFMTDERTYRSPHPCGEGQVGQRYVTLGCDQQFADTRSMLGQTQRDWLVQGVTGSTSLWKVWGNEVLHAPLRLSQTSKSVYIILDAWDGYVSERSYLAGRFKQANVRNLVLLTGDLHTSLASYLKVNYSSDPLNLLQSNMVGVEFMTPAVTSANLKQLLGNIGVAVDIGEVIIRLTNPHIRFFDGEHWGYSTVEFNSDYCEYTVFNIDKSQNSGSVAKNVLKRLRVPVNKVKISEV